MHKTSRRQMMTFIMTCGAIGAAVRMGLVTTARAAQSIVWPKDAFGQTSESGALKAFYNGRTSEPSERVTVNAPEIAENGAVVPVSVYTTLPDVRSVAFLVPGNPFTLAAAYTIPDGTMPTISCRLKMAKSAMVVVMVDSGGKLYSAERLVKVTLGGCG